MKLSTLTSDYFRIGPIATLQDLIVSNIVGYYPDYAIRKYTQHNTTFINKITVKSRLLQVMYK